MLDIGSGDAKRALSIARHAGIAHVTLLEPSAAMRREWPSGVTVWPIRAEQLREQNGSFQVITCLWNVLGHIFPEAARVEVLRQMARLLAPGGKAFVDVSHRYNARHYGRLPTLVRMAGDLLRDGAGDVLTRWTVGAAPIVTRGHVFTDSEFHRLSRMAGLRIEQTHSVDYSSGVVHASRLRGHLLYRVSGLRPVLRCAEEPPSRMSNFIQVTPFMHVPKLDEALRFFSETLGFNVTFRQADYAFVRRENVAFRLMESEPGCARRGKRDFAYYIDVNDVDGLYRSLKPKLDQLPEGDVYGPVDQSYGQREFMVLAPDGDLIVFGQHTGQAA